MPQPIAQAISVTAREAAILERIVRRPSAAQALVTRAKIVLQAHAGKTNVRIATELKVTRNTVREWRARWQADGDRRAAVASERETLQPLANLIETSLGDAYRSGSPGKFSAEQVAQIIAIACEDPQVSS